MKEMIGGIIGFIGLAIIWFSTSYLVAIGVILVIIGWDIQEHTSQKE